MKELKQRTCVVIIGMHRSGTSALAGMLDVLGIYPGENLLEASSSNKKGYFENSKVYELNKEILASKDSSWDDEFFDITSIDKKNKKLFIEKAKEILTEDYKHIEFFLIKDPRVCLLFSIWEQAFLELKIDIKPVFIIRNPIEVSLSLAKRNKLSIEKGLILWAHHYLQAMSSVGDEESLFINYDDLLYETENIIKKLEVFIGFNFTDSIKNEAFQFLDKGIKNNRIAQTKIVSVPDIFNELYNLLIPEKISEEKIKKIDTKFYSLIDFFKIYKEIAVKDSLEMSLEIIQLKQDFIELKQESQLLKSEQEAAEKEITDKKEIIEKISKKIISSSDTRIKNMIEIPAVPKVDIVIPVYNATKYVRACLQSIFDSNIDYINKIIVVNDGSLNETASYLREVDQKEHLLCLIEKEINEGYTKAVNSGLKESDASYVILLNSDTVVSEDWLEGLLRCAESKSNVGIVGPLSNAASWQTVPTLFTEENKFKVNELPEDMTVNDMSFLIKKHSLHAYPEVPVVNGFCFLIKREVINQIGLMDDDNFPIGYGEENDYCIRARDAGYSLLIADDTYVFHSKSKSFGTAERDKLSKDGSKALEKKHGKIVLDEMVREVKDTPALGAMRKRVKANLEIRDLSHKIPVQEISIIFILPSPGAGGGSHSIVQEVTAMQELGINAKIGVELRHVPNLHKRYIDIDNVENLFIGYTEDTLLSLSKNYDVVVATIFYSVAIIKKIIEVYPHIMPAYYVQDYEPMFFTKEDERKAEAHLSYKLIKNNLLFAKTAWIARQVALFEGEPVMKVSPSIDHLTYSPALNKKKSNILKVVAMIRPQTPYRGASRTMEVLSKVKSTFGDKVEIEVFGSEDSHSGFSELKHDFEYNNLGVIDRPSVAKCLQSADIFIDLSDYQAFGRTSLEAMACGCVAMLPRNGGGDEYAIDNYNALVVDTLNEEGCFTRLCSLIKNPQQLELLKKFGLETSSRYSSKNAAMSELELFTDYLTIHRKRYPKKNKLSVCIVPVRREDDEPVGSAYIRLIQPYVDNANLDNKWEFLVADKGELPSVNEADIAIIQRNGGGLDKNKIVNWLLNWKAAGRKCVLEIDDDLFSAEELGARTNKSKKDNQDLVELVRWMASNVDAVIVSTPLLSQVAAQYNDNVFLLPNYLDENLWEIKSAVPPKRYTKQKNNKVIKIGYMGTPTHDEDLSIVKEALKRIESEYGSKVEIEVIGAFQKRLSNPIFGKSVGLPKNTTYEQFVEWLKIRVDWDIAVIPLADNSFNNSKSHLKFLDCTALGMASICSKVSAYNFIVNDNINGLIVNNDPEEWYKAIKSLIDDPKLRQNLFQNAYKDLFKGYTISANHLAYDEILMKIDELPISMNMVRGDFLSDKTIEREKRNKLFLKLKNNPRRYFSDSKNKYIRPLRYLFKVK